MIWLTWRQARGQIISLAGVVVILGVTMALFTVGAIGSDPGGFLVRLGLSSITPALYLVGAAACLAAPPVIGAFWGAPLIARELETGTFRLAWSQGVSRTRWLAIKLGGLALVAALLTGLLSLAVTWWAGPIDEAAARGGNAGVFGLPRIAPVLFSARGVVPASYAVVGVTVGALIGLLVRRTVAALALALIVMILLQTVMWTVAREHLMSPVVTKTAITADNLRGLMIRGDPGQGETGAVEQVRVDVQQPHAWELSNRTLDRAGRVQSTLPGWVADCGNDPMQAEAPGVVERRQACFTRLAAEGYQQEVRTQPGTRFWALQWRESALMLALAAIAAGLCFGHYGMVQAGIW